MARRMLQRVALVARRHYRVVLLASLGLLVISVITAGRLQFDSDVLNLLPRQAPEVQLLRGALEEFGSLDLLVVAIRVPEGAILDPYTSFAAELGERLERLQELSKVDYKLGEIHEHLETLMPQAMLFLDETGRQAVEMKLTEQALHQRARELKRLVATPQALAMKQVMQLDPLGLAGVFLDRLSSSRAGLKVDWASGYLLSQDHRMLLILAKPSEPPHNVEFARKLVGRVTSAIEGVTGQWGGIEGTDGLAAPEVALGGRYVIALGDESLIRRDAVVNVLSSMLGVLALFLIAFRRISLLMYAFFPLCLGLGLTFALAAIVYGSLSAATSGVAALLIGLGIDFVIVSYGRFVEERKKGETLEGALSKMSGSCGRAVVVGAVTSAATFYSFGVTDFTGLSQMGFLTGTGILFCMVAVLWLLPAMLAWSEDHQQRREKEVRLFLHGLGSSHLVRASLRHPALVLAFGVVLTAVSAGVALKLEFLDSVQAMRPQGNPGVLIREEVADRFGLGLEQMMLIVRGETLAEVLELVELASGGAHAMMTEGVLTGYDAVTSVLPTASRQQENLDWLRAGRKDRLNVARVRETFSAAALREGLRPEAFSPGLDLFARAVSRDKPLEIRELQMSLRTRSLVERYLLKSDGAWKSVLYLYPPARLWQREAPPEVVALADSLGPQVDLTGANVVSRFLRERVLRDAAIAAILGLALVTVLLWLDYRRVNDTLLSLAPLLTGIVWMLASMVLLGESMNFMNIFVTTMIIGIGVDYGIHMVHRFRELASESHDQLAAGLIETGKAIVLAALSTTVGFGSLALSHYPGLRSMGKVAVLGAISTALVAITLLPAILVLVNRRRQQD